ncbi:MAG TPA: hypothetical protein VM940_12250 [Chthoniobacterales bacterium]|nr:hypothetical protein [Chthoniobacterales bacterium]
MLARLSHKPAVREILIFLAFCFFTAVVTWPYAWHLRDAVADSGDPYLVTWILWWDYHQTFTDPLHLFHSNLFYPLRYTLAFSEHCYGIALPFFPLFALGVRPLTVHVIALFLGFAFCGYGAFRLTRTLTGSSGAGWIAGIAFAFVPFRFGMMSHLPYLFSGWIPLVFEALVLFTRERSWKRAWWFGVAFFMLGLTTVSWFTFSLVPLLVVAVVLLTRYGIWRDPAFWMRSAVALGLACLALLPFMWPYHAAARLYNFRRSIEEVKGESALPHHWLSAEPRNRFWRGLGQDLPKGTRFRLFPGLLPILLSLSAWLFAVVGTTRPTFAGPALRNRSVALFDVLAILTIVVAIPVFGTAGLGKLKAISNLVSSDQLLAVLAVIVLGRLCLAYPLGLRFQNANLVDTLRSERRPDAFWVGLVLVFIGFFYSLGWNFVFYRVLYNLIPMFQSMRVAVRGSMFAYLGLAILAGLGAKSLAEFVRERYPRIPVGAVVGIIGALLLFELNAARLKLERGDISPDAVSLRLRDTPMRGGLVVLPTNASVNHHHILRAADHMKPLIVGTSGFDSPFAVQIELKTRAGPIPPDFMQFLEDIPTSYVVVKNHLLPPERRVDYEAFLGRAVAAGRLRFVNRFDGRDDLYAVVKTQPAAKSEATIPFPHETRDWSELLKEDPVNLLGNYRSWAQTICRLYLATYGTMPRFAELVPDAVFVGAEAIASSLDDQQSKLDSNLRRLAEEWAERPRFRERFGSTTEEQFIDALSANAGIPLSAADRAALIEKARGGSTARANALLAFATRPDFAAREANRSLVLLHYFGYLHRNPDDPPDRNMDGFNHWLHEIEASGEPDRLSRAFLNSNEYREVQSRTRRR